VKDLELKKISQETDIKFMEAINRSVDAIEKRLLLLEEGFGALILEADARFRELHEYVNDFLLNHMLKELTQKENIRAASMLKYLLYRIDDTEGCIKGFIQKYYQDQAKSYTDKKTNNTKYIYSSIKEEGFDGKPASD